MSYLRDTKIVKDLSEKEYFSPLDDSVIFASAYDGWAFRVSDFSLQFSKKLNVTELELISGMWGQFTYDSKHKKIVKTNSGKSGKTLFSQLILENIWAVYDAIYTNKYLI